MAKRLFDLFASLFGLFLLSPLLLLIALLIKLDSRGPVFFRQERIGRHRKTFRIHKFRTMVVDAEKKGPQLTVGKDSRITRTGHFLRRYKLDELPQLLDVISGNMSLVGPRPEVPKYVEYYPQELLDAIFSVRPGITDRASIEFRDENRLLGQSATPDETYIREIIPIKLGYHMEYVRHRSFTGDLKLILKTLFAIFR